MNGLQAFWAFIYYLQHITVGCQALLGPARSTEANPATIIYGGNCVQAWLLAVHIPGVTWVLGS